MNAPDFLDTNVLVYAYDRADQRKQRVARDLLRRALDGGAIVSAQVLAEFAATLLHKLTPALSPSQVSVALEALTPIRTILPDAGMVQRAVEARQRYGLHFYDGMVVAAAERGECRRILTEDLNPGQKYFGAIAENPFA